MPQNEKGISQLFHFFFAGIFLPDSCADLQNFAEPALDSPQGAPLFVETAYNCDEWEDSLSEIENPRLQMPRKANSKRGREPWFEARKSWMRKYIETTIGEVEKVFPKKIYATT